MVTELWAWAILLLVIGSLWPSSRCSFPPGTDWLLAFAAIVGGPRGLHGKFLTGLAILAISILGLPVVIAFGLKWWPHTPIGKRVLLHAPDSDEVLPDDPKRGPKSLVGKVGRAKSRMLPSGPAVMIEGRTIDAVSEGFRLNRISRSRSWPSTGRK